MLDGASRLDDLFAEASKQGMSSIAMTDHGNLFGAYDFWKRAPPQELNPSSDSKAITRPKGVANASLLTLVAVSMKEPLRIRVRGAVSTVTHT